MVLNVIGHHWLKNHGRSHLIIHNYVFVNSSWHISLEICQCVLGSFFKKYKYFSIGKFYMFRCHTNVFYMVVGPPKRCFLGAPKTGTENRQILRTKGRHALSVSDLGFRFWIMWRPLFWDRFCTWNWSRGGHGETKKWPGLGFVNNKFNRAW